jgi:hypothetical protein
MKAIVLGVILLWTSLAWGECAWVLWEQHRYLSWWDRWRIVGAFESREACMGDSRVLNESYQHDPGFRRYHHGWAEYSAYSSIARCFPDTVDPRDPKR